MKKLIIILIFSCSLFVAKSQTFVSFHNYYFYYTRLIQEPTITIYTLTPLTKKIFFSSYALARPSWSQIVMGFDVALAKWLMVGFKAGIQSSQNGNMMRYSPSLVISYEKFQFFGVYEWGGIKDRSQTMTTYKLEHIKPGIMSVQSASFLAIGPMVEFVIPRTPFSIYGSAMMSQPDSRFASQFGIYYRIKPKRPEK